MAPLSWRKRLGCWPGINGGSRCSIAGQCGCGVFLERQDTDSDGRSEASFSFVLPATGSTHTVQALEPADESVRGWRGWFFRQMVKVHPIFQFEHIVSLKSSSGRFFQKGSCIALHLGPRCFMIFPLHPVGSFAMNGNQSLELRSAAWMSFETHLDCYQNTLQAYNANVLESLMLFLALRRFGIAFHDGDVETWMDFRLDVKGRPFTWMVTWPKLRKWTGL